MSREVGEVTQVVFSSVWLAAAVKKAAPGDNDSQADIQPFVCLLQTMPFLNSLLQLSKEFRFHILHLSSSGVIVLSVQLSSIWHMDKGQVQYMGNQVQIQ